STYNTSMSEMLRRTFLQAASAAALGRMAFAADDAWTQAEEILRRIRPPSLRDRDFDITRFGAKSGGKSDCTEAFRSAIDACNKAGGGRVLVPAGEFLTGAIHLRSNINLHLAAGSVVRFSRDDRQYLPLVYTRWEGLECMNYSPFVYAYKQENIAITGSGTLDGNADCEHW